MVSGQVSFSSPKKQGCAPLNTTFVDATVGAVRWLWDFGNGNTSTLQNPSAQYILPGKFTVILTVWDANGVSQTGILSDYITVFKNPIADLSIDKLKACVNEAITFTNTSTLGDASFTGYSWDFGNGSILNSASPSYAYPAAGNYNVSFVVTDANGCFHKVTKNNYLEVFPKPKASFTVDITYDCVAPSTTTFTNNSTGSGLTYEWDFGDGGTSNVKTPSHTYTAAGKYDIKLKVKSDNGCTDEITVKDGFIIGPMTVDFTSDKTTLCNGGAINFQSLSSTASSIASSWDFGNGTTSTSPYPTVVYNLNKRYYDVSLTIKSVNKPNCSATIKKPVFISVFPKPNGSLTTDNPLPCQIPFTTNWEYKDSITSTNIVWRAYNWDMDTTFIFGNGQNPAKLTIGNKDEYKIWATVTNKYGCTDTIGLPLVVKKVKLEAIIEGDTSGCAPIFMKLKDVSEHDHDIVERRWYLNNSYTSADEIYNLFLQQMGDYRVTLKIKDQYGCEDSTFVIIPVGVHWDPKFILFGSKRVLCNNTDSILLINRTRFNKDTIMDEFIWFGDSTWPEGKTVKVRKTTVGYGYTNRWIKYKQTPGYVTPMLISINRGCHDTFKMHDSIKIQPPFARMELIGNPCFDSTLQVLNKSIDYHRWKWEVNNITKLEDSLLLNNRFNQNIKLTVYNDTTKCWDTIYREYRPVQVDLQINSNLSGVCTPATLTLGANKPLSSGYWIINNGPKIYSNSPLNLKLDTAGTYDVSFYYVVGLCEYTTNKKFKIGNGQMKGSVTTLAGCSPTRVTLVDSTYKQNDTNHVWIINGKGFPVREFSKTIELPNFSADEISIILRDKTPGNLCTAEQTFIVKTSGPGFTLRSGWSNTCEKSFFQGNLMPNPAKGAQPYSFSWKFSNGSQYGTQVISHGVLDTGNLFVVMRITDANGCYATDTYKYYMPPGRIVVDFTADKKGSTCTPLYVDFFDKSTSLGQSIVAWDWNFGDNSSSSFKNPRHQYLNPGVYDITLTVRDNIGCTKKRVYPKYIVLKGPEGTYTTSDRKGCTPHTVNFRETTNSPLAKMIWDYGDGIVDTAYSPNHTYTRPGIYIPSLIVKEKAGCEYAVPQTDTIFIYENPIADITGNGICLKDNITFTQADQTIRDAITNRWWIFPEKTVTGNLQTVNHRFTQKNNTKLTYVIQTENGCKDTINKYFVLKQPEITVWGDKDTLCLGASFAGNAIVTTDTTLRSRDWLVNDNFYSNTRNLIFTPTKPGTYKITMRAEDEAGCWDTASYPQLVNVGDTSTPPVVPMRFVSVYDDNTHQINFNRLPSSDFYQYTILQENGGVYTPTKIVRAINDTNQYIYGVNALNRSYCYKLQVSNLCRYTNNINILESHCTVEAKASPLLNAARVTWSPYAGWPVKKYDILRQNLVTQDYDSIGTVSGNTFVFIDSNIICRQKHSYLVQAHSQADTIGTHSFSDTCQAMPFYFNTVNPPIFTRATVENGEFVNLEWEEIFPNRNPIVQYDINRRTAGKTYQFMQSNAAADLASVNDMKTEVNDEYCTYIIRSIDACNDTSRYADIAQSILLKTNITAEYEPLLNWTAYKDWPQGVKEYVVEKRIDGAGFEEIGRVGPSDTSYKDKFSELNCIPAFDYRVYAIRAFDTGSRSIRSYSNYSTPSVAPKIFVPNAFSPNQNRLNESFRPVGIFIQGYRMQIYNRWGQKIYDNDECMNAWDGTFNGEPAADGVFVYKILARGINGEIYNLVGNVTLIR